MSAIIKPTGRDFDLGERRVHLDTIFTDLNGTLVVHNVADERIGKLMEGLKKDFRIVLLTGDVKGTGRDIAERFGIDIIIAKDASDKARIVREESEKEHAISIGNARIDIGMFENSELRIGTLQGEGIHPAIIPHVDIIVPSMYDALNLLNNPLSLRATFKQ